MITANRLDKTYLSRGVCPPFAIEAVWPNLPFMVETVDMDSIRAVLRSVMERKGIKPTTLSLKVGTNRTLVKDLFVRNSDIGINTLTKLAGALDIPVSELLSAPRVSIVGKIGAGGAIIFEDVGFEDDVIRPPGVSGSIIALVVEGDSMLPKFRSGDIIYIQKVHEGVTEDEIGEDCAVRLATGETYIKQLIRGSEVGKFTLLSLNAPPIENVEILWATRVAFIMPARSRHLFS